MSELIKGDEAVIKFILLADGHTDCFQNAWQVGKRVGRRKRGERFCNMRFLNRLKELLGSSKLSGLNYRLHAYSRISNTCLAALPTRDGAQF